MLECRSNQTLAQMLRYFEEERYEMVEVMASEFTSMLLANKTDGATQTLLVKGVRILAKSYRYETNTN